MEFDLIIKNKRLIHVSNFSVYNLSSHFFIKEFNFCNIYKCERCNVNVFLDDNIKIYDTNAKVIIIGCYILGVCSNMMGGGINGKHDLSCDEVIIKNIIE